MHPTCHLFQEWEGVTGELDSNSCKNMYYNVIYIYKVNRYKKMTLIKKNANIFHIKIIIYLIKIHLIMQIKYYINNTKMHVRKKFKKYFLYFQYSTK